MLDRNKILKHLKIGIDEVGAIAIIAIGTVLRLLLISQGWPLTNSDEGTMGLMAMHIAYHGEHPIFFYGQNYMGSLETFLGAGLFRLFGPSLFTLRLGLVLLFVFFLISMYLLTSLLYSKRLALVTLILLSLGSEAIMNQELFAIGGYPETLLFGALVLFIASWLALTSARNTSRHDRWQRYVVFGCWGLAAGLGLWSDLLIFPFVFVAGLLLIVGCWREWRTWALPCLLLGFVIGAFPLIYYNLTAQPGQDSLSVLFSLRENDLRQHLPFIDQVKGALLFGVPIITSVNPTCPGIGGRYIGFAGPHPFLCSLEYFTWGAGFIVLWLIAILLAIAALWKLRPRTAAQPWSHEERQTAIRHFARLMLLGGASLAMFIYLTSPNAAMWPVTNYRYLIGLLIAIPAVISPLWVDALTVARNARIKAAAKGMVLLLIGLVFLVGTMRIFYSLPVTQAVDRQQDMLVHDLLDVGATRIYSDYWTCNRISFLSNEKIICAVIDANGQIIENKNRYTPYIAIVKADAHAAYVLPFASPWASTYAGKAALQPGLYQHYTFDGYEIYLPQVVNQP